MYKGGVTSLLLLVVAWTVSGQTLSSPTQAAIPLYLTNTVLDSYGPRQGTNTAVSF